MDAFRNGRACHLTVSIACTHNSESESLAHALFSNTEDVQLQWAVYLDTVYKCITASKNENTIV